MTVKRESNFDASIYSNSIKEWRNDPCLETANEVLVNASFFGLRPEARPALEAIADERSDAVIGLQRTAATILRQDDRSRRMDAARDTTMSRDETIQQIRRLKRRVKIYPRDGLAQMELARQKASIGQSKDAERHVHQAVSLYPNNRFIVRSAARYFTHIARADIALDVVKRSELFAGDPWVQSAEVAVCGILGRTPASAAKQAKVLASMRAIRFDQTELAAGLGALEMNAGAIKKAKRLFEKSMKVPNENALAQLRWVQVSGTVGFSQIQPARHQLRYSYEADFYTALADGAGETAVVAAAAWLDDEPYSQNPALVGSSLSIGLLDQPQRAIPFVEHGLSINPKSELLANNKIVALARMGQTEISKQLLSEKRRWQNDPALRPFYFAAEGLIGFREGRGLDGRKAYLAAFDAAKQTSDDLLALMALAYWLEEEAYIPGAPWAEIIRCVEILSDKIEKLPRQHSHFLRYWAAIKARIQDARGKTPSHLANQRDSKFKMLEIAT